MRRSILAVLAGFIVANLTVFVIEFAGHKIYPPPPGFNPYDPASVRALMAKMPTGAFLLILLGGVIGAATGASVAALLSRRAPIVHGMIVGGLVTAGAIGNVLMIPHPLWFQVTSPASMLPAAYVGAWLVNRRKKSTQATGNTAQPT